MQEIINLQQKIVPEMIELLQKRYNILKTIYYNAPLGRRALAVYLGIGERIVRTEIDFLKEQKLISVSAPGMFVTAEGEELIEKLKEFVHKLKGLSELEQLIEKRLGIKKAIVVLGDIEEDKAAINELGRAAAAYLKEVIVNESIIAVTGGYSVKAVISSMSNMTNVKDILVVPARGGMGRNVETQANSLAAELAKKLNGSYRLLHVPDNLSSAALNTLMNERDVKEVVDIIHRADTLVYGIGRADEMAKRRGLSQNDICRLNELEAVGEAFGCYFNKAGGFVYAAPTIGVQREDISKFKHLIAVAGGKDKAEAIIAIESSNTKGVLITDESAAREILSLTK